MKKLLKMLCAFVYSCAVANSALAGGFIRDAEIEHYLTTLSSPIFHAAGLPPESVHIFMIEQDSINAFVAGGSNIFLHTGLLLKTETPETLIGVIAHETGHIAGGHLLRGTEQLQAAQIGTILSYVLGAAAVATGAKDAGMAVMSAGGQVAQRGMLANSRTNEESADQAALRFLDANHISAAGMLAMFETLRRQEKQHYATLDPYTLTHPLSQERLIYIRNHLDTSPYKDATLAQPIHLMHQRMLGKLEGFLEDPDIVLTRYAAQDKDIRARYARAVAYYRKSDMPHAIEGMDAIIKDYPSDPFFIEMKGQILFEHGKINEAITAFYAAHHINTQAPLIDTELAQALLSATPLTPAKLEEAISLLTHATIKDATYDLSWQLLAEAQGKAGHKGEMYLALAEKASLQEDIKSALALSKKASEILTPHSPPWQRAQDIHQQAEREDKNNKDEKPKKTDENS